MTRVDYYILGTQDSSERLHFTCRIIAKAYKQGCQVFVHTEDEDAASQVDEALWSFRRDSFIPHNRLSENPQIPATIEIGSGQPPGRHHDVLINLSNQIPDFFSRFNRVAEIVFQQPEILEASRANYAFYRERGYPLESHDLRDR